MKINKDKILRLMDKRMHSDELDSPDAFNGYLQDVVDAMGDDEEEVLEFLKSLDETQASFADEFYEETVEKFPSEAIEEWFAGVMEIYEH